MNETTDDSQKRLVNNLTNKYNILKLNLKIYYNENNPHYDKDSIKLVEDSKFSSQYLFINSIEEKYTNLIKIIEDGLVTFPDNTYLQKLKDDALILYANFKQAKILFSNEYERRLLEPLPIIQPPSTNGGKNKKNKKSKKSKKGKSKSKKYTFRKNITKMKSKKK
jgi:hypothetical protein